MQTTTLQVLLETIEIIAQFDKQIHRNELTTQEKSRLIALAQEVENIVPELYKLNSQLEKYRMLDANSVKTILIELYKNYIIMMQNIENIYEETRGLIRFIEKNKNLN